MEAAGAIQGMELGCSACGAALHLAVHERSAICPYCATPTVVQRAPVANRPSPSFALGFILPQADARKQVRRWIATRGPFARGDFKRATPDATRGVYLPAYLYGAVARSRYSCEIGETYYTGTGKNRKKQTEWRQLSGEHACYVRDVIVTASSGIPNEDLELVEPFDLRAIKRYDHAIISGWIAEDPSLDADACLELARGEARADVHRRLTRFMPGDSQRNLSADISIEREVLDLVLLPLWVFAVKYHPERPPVRLLVNGQTGEVGGKVPLSAVRITLAVLLVLAAVITFYVLAQR